MFARTYAPKKMPEAVKAWRGDLESKKRGKIAAGIADPTENPELFEESEGARETLLDEAVPPPTALQQPLLVPTIGKNSSEDAIEDAPADPPAEPALSTTTATTDADDDEFVDA